MEEGLNKRNVVSTGVKIVLGVMVFVFLFMWFGIGEIFWNILLFIFLGFSVFVALIIFATYKYSKRNPNIVVKSKKGKKNWGIVSIIFGAFLILTGIIYFVGEADPIGKRAILIRIGFGLFALIWGIYHVRKSRKSNSFTESKIVTH